MVKAEQSVLEAISALEQDEIGELVTWQLEEGRRREGVLNLPDGAEWNSLYPEGAQQIVSGAIDWAADDIKVMLCRRDYENADAHRYQSDVYAEVSGPGYRHTPVTRRTVTRQGDVLCYDADDTVWPAATFHAQRAVVYKDTGDPATSPLICCARFDFGPPVVRGRFAVQWSTLGVLRLSCDEAGRPVLPDCAPRGDSSSTP